VSPFLLCHCLIPYCFVASVSVAGAGGVELWAVEGGNQKVPELLLERSGARLVSKRVAEITKLDDGRLKISPALRSDIPPDDDDDDQFVFDSVVIATPQTKQMPFPIVFKR